MARRPVSKRLINAPFLIPMYKIRLLVAICTLLIMILHFVKKRKYSEKITTMPDRINRFRYLNDMISQSDIVCLEQLRMSRSCFKVLCNLVRDIGGLSDTKNMSVEEMVAIFVHILAYDEKTRDIGFNFKRSGETVSRNFHRVLRAVLKLWNILLKTPKPIDADCRDEKWKWFQNCLGALDGTYIEVKVPLADKARYRTRKQQIATNMLGVCAPDMQFIYVLPGWEGSAADARILRDALSRQNGFKVPRGQYYLVDAGYRNCEGFLAPYRGQRYHLNEWRQGNQPTTAHEYFNMKHSSARNVVERTFGLLKIRWGILRNHNYYPLDTQIDIILACCYLHNLIRQQMTYDPFEAQLDSNMENDGDDVEYIDTVETTNQWTTWRDTLAEEMFSAWRGRRHTRRI